MPILRPGDPRFEQLRFPRPGARLIFRRTANFWFTNMIEDARRRLVRGRRYTLAEIEVYSSCAYVTLREVPGSEFPLSFFDYHRPPEPPRSL